MFAVTAQKTGKIISKNEHGIIIEYADGEKKGITLGRVYGKAEGSTYPHDIVTPLDVNDKFVKGDILAYNTGFFEPDFLEPKRVVMKSSMSVKVALYESNQTIEDSSTISKNLSEKLKAKTTKVKSLTVNFKQNIINAVKPGQKVNPKDLLMIIEDEITSSTDIFDEKSLSVLKKLSNQAPKASYLGTVDKIEVFYHGDKADMTSSLKALADKSDKLLADIAKASNKPVVTGEVTDDYRVSGVPLTLDKAEIKVYITIETTAGVGDKGVFANQLKSVFGEVMDYTMTSERGENIDAVFSYRGICKRIVLSPNLMGTTTTLLKLVAKKAVELYKG
jgi:hypothetical protein